MGWTDTESGLDWTPARFYESRLGRWMTPDPLGGDVTNPQSLNRYAYALNNPTSMIDPSGLDPCPDQPDNPFCIATTSTPNPPPGCDPNDPSSCGNSPGSDSGGSSPIPPELEQYWFWQEWLQWYSANGPARTNNGTGCNAKQAVSFIHTNQAAAATIAQQLNVPVQNILGLSGIESFWGQSNAALKANNFFGLHGGANAPFATGVWYTQGGVAMSSFPSYLASAQSFAAQYGSFVQGVTNPTAFAQALVKAGFNSGTSAGGGNPNFVTSTAATISATAGRMTCP